MSYITDYYGKWIIKDGVEILIERSTEYIDKLKQLEESIQENNEPTIEEKINLQIAQNTAETLEALTTLNEMQKIEQAQSNAEMIELILSLQGGM